MNFETRRFKIQLIGKKDKIDKLLDLLKFNVRFGRGECLENPNSKYFNLKMLVQLNKSLPAFLKYLPNKIKASIQCRPIATEMDFLAHLLYFKIAPGAFTIQIGDIYKTDDCRAEEKKLLQKKSVVDQL